MKPLSVVAASLMGIAGLSYLRQRSQSASESGKTAVIIKGNPAYIEGNPRADAFYQALKRHLEGRGYQVSFDPGEAYTVPPAADLWVGHSRGTDRLEFAPEGTKTVAIGVPGAIMHPLDNVRSWKPGGPKIVPNDYHYAITSEMLEALE